MTESSPYSHLLSNPVRVKLGLPPQEVCASQIGPTLLEFEGVNVNGGRTLDRHALSRMMEEYAYGGWKAGDIARDLNQKRIRTPKGNMWNYDLAYDQLVRAQARIANRDLDCDTELAERASEH